MGRRANKIRSAQRPGRAQRARAKKRFRGETTTYAGGAGIVATVKAGRKKYPKVARFIDRYIQDVRASGGDSAIKLKSWVGTRRPLYTVSAWPSNPAISGGEAVQLDCVVIRCL